MDWSDEEVENRLSQVEDELTGVLRSTREGVEAWSITERLSDLKKEGVSATDWAALSLGQVLDVWQIIPANNLLLKTGPMGFSYKAITTEFLWVPDLYQKI